MADACVCMCVCLGFGFVGLAEYSEYMLWNDRTYFVLQVFELSKFDSLSHFFTGKDAINTDLLKPC